MTTPDSVLIAAAATAIPEDVEQYRNAAMRVLALEAGRNTLGPAAGAAFGKGAAIVFGLLLLSAANTAVMAMVSVLFSMAQDRELPRPFTRLNYSGVPWAGLIAACLLPCAVLAAVRDVGLLARLYAVGVCGAITINVLSCVFNRRLRLTWFERRGMLVLGVLMLAVALTIIGTEWRAALFAGGLVGVVLATRVILRARPAVAVPLPEPAIGWLAEIKRAPAALDASRRRIMLAARGRYQSEFAVDLARRRGAVLFAIYVRTLRLIDVQPGRVPRIEEDPAAQESLGTTAVLAREAGVPFVPIYVTSAEIAEEILDYTVTYGCDTLIMGKSRRSLLARRLVGDVLAEVARHLPDNVALITRASDAPYTPGPLGEPRPPHRPDDEDGAPPT